MPFNSLPFLIFFVVLFGLYYVAPRKGWQLFLLIAGSLFFYGWQNPQLLLLLILSIIANTAISCAVHRIERRGLRIGLAAFGVIANLSLLVSFKYAAMLLQLFDQICHANLCTTGPTAVLMTLPLPIGISFYTFEGVCLLVDTFRRDKAIERSPIRLLPSVALFISFFPHLVAGPIVRPSQFFPQIAAKKFKDINWKFACETLILGYFFKVFVADNLGDILSVIHLFEVMSGPTNLVFMFAYAIRVFADYGGYSYIAVGLAALLGYSLPINFNWPFCATSMSELWHRWNITLGQWLRDYLYIPLGGNKHGTARTCLNLFIVMIVAGLWHGASFRFAVFGALHGLALCFERTFGLHRVGKRGWLVDSLSSFAVFVYFSMTALLAIMPVSEASAFIMSIFTNWTLETKPLLIIAIVIYAAPVVVAHILVAMRERDFKVSKIRFPTPMLLKEAVLAFLLFLVATNPGSSKAFVYFQF